MSSNITEGATELPGRIAEILANHYEQLQKDSMLPPGLTLMDIVIELGTDEYEDELSLAIFILLRGGTIAHCRFNHGNAQGVSGYALAKTFAHLSPARPHPRNNLMIESYELVPLVMKLGRLIGFGFETAVMAAAIGVQADARALEWLIGLAQMFDRERDRFTVITQASWLYAFCDGDLDRVWSVLAEPLADTFSPIDIVGLGDIDNGFLLAQTRLDGSEREAALKALGIEPDDPPVHDPRRRRMPDPSTLCVSALARWERHFEVCATCRNYQAMREELEGIEYDAPPRMPLDPPDIDF